MKKGFYGKAAKTYSFLKKALSNVPIQCPFRGPKQFKEQIFEYEFNFKGNIEQFTGKETIKLEGKETYSQNIIGGLIIAKK